jgi:hypothetical protein
MATRPFIFSYPNDLKLVPGDRVLVQGKTQKSFNPIVIASSITLLGHVALPKAEPASFDQMIRAETDCKLVTVRGVIRTADRTLSAVAPVHFMRLQLLTDGGYFNANVDSDDEGALEGLLDAEVELTGSRLGRIRQQDGSERDFDTRSIAFRCKDHQAR